MVTEPIFVVEGSDVTMFGSMEAAEGWLEAIDVLNGDFELFDSDGRRLQATAESVDSPVVIRAIAGLAPERDVLQAILRDYLRAMNVVRPELGMTADDVSNAPLRDLVLEMQAVEERSRQRSMVSRLRRSAAAIRRRLHGQL